MASKSSQASPKPLTKAYLERVALWYLERYGGSSKRLRAALTRRLGKRLVTDEAQALAWIDEVVEQVQAAGYQDDARWAEAKVQRLSQGHSPLSIRQRLRQEEIPTAEIDALLPQAEAAALDAALTYVRKRRLGHWRAAEVRAAYHQKKTWRPWLGAAFSYGLALKALAGEAGSSG